MTATPASISNYHGAATLSHTSGGRRTLWSGLAIVLAMHMLTVPFTVYLQLYDSGPSWLGLDDSWRLALNYATINDLDWGHEVIYTYGPLSFLSTRVGWGISRWVFLAADLFVVINLAALFRSFILRSANPALAALAVFLLTLAMPVFYGSGLAWVLLIFVFYWMHRSYASPRWWHFGMLATLIALAFYVKLNTGLFAVFFLFGHLAVLLATRKITILTGALVLIALAFLLWMGAVAFHVSLVAYMRGAMEVVKGFSDLMYLVESHPREESRLLYLFFGIIALIAIGAVAPLRRKQFGAVFLLALAGAYLFLLKKQASFRNDIQHLEEFFAYAPLVLFWGITGVLFPGRNVLVLLAVCVVTGACLVFASGDQPLAFIQNRVVSRYTVPYQYGRELISYAPEKNVSQRDKRYIPECTLSRIGQGTVDVFPWDANYAIQNRLRYTPRPCFQTFQANSDYLQRTNLDFYKERGPRFVIYDYDAIDGTYPFNDAPTMNLFLSRAYDVVDTFTSNERWRILLERKPAFSAPRLKSAGTSTIALNEPVPVAMPYVRLKVSYTLLGKLKAIWDKPSLLQVAYQTPDGAWKNHKTSPELLKTGLYTGRYIQSNEDFAHFVTGDTAALPSVRAIKIIGSPRSYDGTVSVEYFDIR